MNFVQAKEALFLEGVDVGTTNLARLAIMQEVNHKRDLNQLLTKFPKLLQPLQGILPNHKCDHKIRLKLGISLTIVRPHYYPHSQNNEIKKQGEE